MTEPRGSLVTPRQDLLDTNALAYSGRALDAATQAASVRRWGWWYQAEWRLRSMKAYWSSIIGTALLTPLLYVVAMGIGLGSLVDANAGGIGGVAYLTFVAPGLLVSTVVMSGTAEMSYPVMAGFKWGRLYYARATTAASPQQVALGELLAVFIRLLAEALVFYAVLVAMGAVQPGWSVVMVPVAGLAGMAFGAPLGAYAATLENEGPEFPLIQRFVVMPMFLFAGTFFPLASMPVYLQWVGWISPMWHGTQLARAVGYGMPLSGADVLVHLGFLVAVTAIGVWLALRSFVERLGR
ncbi:MAG TPA: ABC transporter permease [Propionicimonas sp.]|nr:ABC transporter permease [Propionicimonas sp.]